MSSIKNYKVQIHPTSDVQSSHIGSGTQIWQYCVVLPGARIGKDCNINCHVFIENEVVIGDRVTVKSGIYIWDRVTIEDDVFLGPNVVFTNDLMPRSKLRNPYLPILIQKGASIGANTTLLAGITIGRFAMTGIGSVVTRDVPAHALVFGVPATIRGWVSETGEKLVELENGLWGSSSGDRYKMTETGLERLR